ncbi:hypothetical protein PAXRUDRAFT_71039, partial [Paxillus rubicundulus Ve08.2h10]
VFGSILMKWRNQLSTKNLTRLAELKMYVHEEHVRNDAVKKHLNDQEDLEGPASNSEGLGATTGRSPSQGISCIAQSLIQVVDKEDQEPEYSAAETSSTAQQYSPITIKELLDYSHAEAWLGSFYQTAIRCLDDDLELYQLLNLDADGIDDPDY